MNVGPDGRNQLTFICGSESEVEPPVLKHGPRSLILVQVDGLKSRRRNESDVSQALQLQEKPINDSFIGLS